MKAKTINIFRMLLARNTMLFKTRNVSYKNLLNYVLCMSADVF